MFASAAHTLKLELYIGARKGLSANMKLGLPGTVAKQNLSFRVFEDQRKKFRGCLFMTRLTNVGKVRLQN